MCSFYCFLSDVGTRQVGCRAMLQWKQSIVMIVQECMWQSRYASGEVVMSVVKLCHLQECLQVCVRGDPQTVQLSLVDVFIVSRLARQFKPGSLGVRFAPLACCTYLEYKSFIEALTLSPQPTTPPAWPRPPQLHRNIVGGKRNLSAPCRSLKNEDER